MRRVLIIVASVGMLSACSKVADLGQRKGLSDLAKIEQRWSDGVELAGATSKIALSPQVATLQTIRRDLNALEVDDCLALAKTSYVQHMNYVIAGFLAFMRDDKS